MKLRNFVAALVHREDIWKNDEKIRKYFEIRGHKS